MSATLRRPVQVIIRGLRNIHNSAIRNETFTATDAIMPKPQPSKILGYMGVTVATSVGMFVGASMSKNIASFLEENELFVPSDDDDDD